MVEGRKASAKVIITKIWERDGRRLNTTDLDTLAWRVAISGPRSDKKLWLADSLVRNISGWADSLRQIPNQTDRKKFIYARTIIEEQIDDLKDLIRSDIPLGIWNEPRIKQDIVMLKKFLPPT
jgi:hypothetical protein